MIPKTRSDTNRLEAEQVIDRLRVIWCSIVPATPPDLSGTADLFRSGGDSLAFLRLLARVRELWGVEISTREGLSAPTLDALTRTIVARAPRQDGDR